MQQLYEFYDLKRFSPVRTMNLMLLIFIKIFWDNNGRGLILITREFQMNSLLNYSFFGLR